MYKTKYKLVNGWTKESVMKQIKKYNLGSPAFNGKLCCYLTKDGNRCAIGCFIPDGHKGLKELESVVRLLSVHKDLESKMPFDDMEALIEFQAVHDNCIDNDVHQQVQTFLNERVI